MTASASTPCPRCGSAASGAFCSQCGLPLGDRPCPSCGNTLSAGDRFCNACGAPAVGQLSPLLLPTPRNSRLPWAISGLLTVIAITAVAYATRARAPSSASDGATPVAASTPPDLSQMTPKEQFDRLNDRVTRAAEQGDSATAVRFWPMAASAYDNLPPGDRDIDARFHMAWLHFLVAEYPQTLALADTIMTTAPGDLFGYYLRAAVASAQGDSAKANAERKQFRAHFDAEIKKTDRPEYVDHRAMLDQFFKAP
jgi:hypothetical protein